MNDDLKWYYLENGKSLGPFTKDQLIQLAFTGMLAKETLIWSPSQNQEWRPLNEALNLKDELPPPLPNTQVAPALQPSDAATVIKVEGEQAPHPWRRYLARMLDCMANGSVMWVAIGMLLAVFMPVQANQFFQFIGDPKNKFADIFLTCLIVPFANAAFIGFTGSSIGKWFFGVRVLNASDRVIGYKLALKREFLVWQYGLGCGVPLLNIIAALHQRDKLDKNKITSWDKDLNLKIVYRKSGAVQYLLSIVGFLLYFVIYAALTKM